MTDKPLTDRILELPDGELYYWTTEDDDPGYARTHIQASELKALVQKDKFVDDYDATMTMEPRLLTAIKAYLEPQPNDAQSERVHAELVAAIEEAEKL